MICVYACVGKGEVNYTVPQDNTQQRTTVRAYSYLSGMSTWMSGVASQEPMKKKTIMATEIARIVSKCWWRSYKTLEPVGGWEFERAKRRERWEMMCFDETTTHSRCAWRIFFVYECVTSNKRFCETKWWIPSDIMGPQGPQRVHNSTTGQQLNDSTSY